MLLGFPLFSITQENIISKISEKNILIFINGYRGPKFNKLAVDNKMYTKDPTGYWYKYDDTIVLHRKGQVTRHRKTSKNIMLK